MSEKFVEVEMFTGDYMEGENIVSEGIVNIHKNHKLCYDNGEFNFFEACEKCKYWICGSHEMTSMEDEQYICPHQQEHKPGSKIKEFDEIRHCTGMCKRRTLHHTCMWQTMKNGYWESHCYICDSEVGSFGDFRDKKQSIGCETHFEWVENKEVALSDTDQLAREELILKDIIIGARKVQEFLWGEMNAKAGLEEYRRMLRKRLSKMEEITTDNPHWKVEFRKRLLQLSAISVQVLYKISEDVLGDGVHPYLSSNLGEYSDKVKMDDLGGNVRHE